MMSNTNLQQNTVIIGERDYEAALDAVIAAAQNELLIFDQDLAKGNYASAQRFTLIQQFLNKNQHNKLTIIVQNSQFFKAHCPRLFDLLETFAHKMTVYETNDNAKIAKDCFVLADKQHYCRRFHIDQARFKYALNNSDEETVAGLLTRFDELLAETAHHVSVTKLGL